MPPSSTPVFAIKQTPFNARLYRWLLAGPFIRRIKFLHERICEFIAWSGLGGSSGSFTYRRKGEARNVRFNGRNAQFHAIYDYAYRAGYEFETGLLLTRLCEGRSVFYDVGANWGYFSLLIAASPQCEPQCHAFEPNPSTFRDLCSIVEQAGVGNCVRPWNLGVGRARGTLHLAQKSRFLTGITQLSADGAGPGVSVIPLDETEAPPPTVIKIDAEGMETEILHGTRRILTQHRPMVVFESFLQYGRPKETFAPISFLRSLEYRCFIPTLRFQHPDGPVLASYGDDFAALLLHDPKPAFVFVPVDETSRFAMRWQLNLLACPADRISDLPGEQLVVN